MQASTETQCSRCGEPEGKHSRPQCRYNGWENRETWAVHLWLSNEESTYNYWRNAASHYAKNAPADERVKDGIWTREQAARFNLADYMKERFETEAEKMLGARYATMWGDLLTGALGNVNWHEVAEAFLEE